VNARRTPDRRRESRATPIERASDCGHPDRVVTSVTARRLGPSALPDAADAPYAGRVESYNGSQRATVSFPEPRVEAIADDARRLAAQHRPKLGVLDERLLAHISAHIADEGKLVGAYQAIADQLPDEYVRYLTGLIVTDEQRHHQLLAEMANYLVAGNGTDVRPRIPWLTKPKRPAELRAAVGKLIRSERRDRRGLRRLRRALRPYRRTSLLVPLVDTMVLDTRKHLLLLTTIRRTART
jgi:hypothetical protein